MAQAASITVFNSSFTAGEGFSDGSIGFGAPNPDTIIGPGVFTVTDSAGTGTLSTPGNSFGRALFGWTGVDESTITGLQAGSTITVAASNLTIQAAAGSNRNLMILGLSNVDSGNILGNTSGTRHGHLVADSAGNIYAQNDNFAVNIGAAVDTNFNVGEAFNYTVLYTALGGGLFNVEQQVNGSTVFTLPNVSLDFSKSGPDTTGIIQDFGGATGITMDALSFSYDPVPEPSTSALLLCLLPTALLRRRRA